MIEVFKTNIQTELQAEIVLKAIHQLHDFFQCNFDLEDADRILRVENKKSEINIEKIIKTIEERGFKAEVLTEESEFRLSNK